MPSIPSTVRVKIAVAVLVAVVCSVSARAENFWKSGFNFAPERMAQDDVRHAVTRDAGKHVFVQLERPPTGVERARFLGAGCMIQQSVGRGIYTARLLPDARADALLDSRLIGWVAPIPWELKVHHRFHEADLAPDLIVAAPIDPGEPGDRRDPIVALLILLHDDEPVHSLAMKLTRRFGATIAAPSDRTRTLVAEVERRHLQAIAELDEVLWIEPPLPPMGPFVNSYRNLTEVDLVKPETVYDLSGEDVNVMVFDVGGVRTSHTDFDNRVMQIGCPSIDSHSTTVAGIIGADGTSEKPEGQYAGIAPESNIFAWALDGQLYDDMNNLFASYTDAIETYFCSVANASVGVNVYIIQECPWLGDYPVTSALIDELVLGDDKTPPIIAVWAAGNERVSPTCGNLFGTIPPPAGSKNPIAVGGVNSNSDSVAIFSSWGPTDDGRLKPDIVAPGHQNAADGFPDEHPTTPGTTTIAPSADTGYNTRVTGGTSWAAPVVTGIVALMLEDYRRIFGTIATDPLSATVKAILAHSAQDLESPGPDYKTGYGSVRAKQAIDLLRERRFAQGVVDNEQFVDYVALVIEGDSELKVTLAWDDVPGSTMANLALVNDLDLALISPCGEWHHPWMLDHTTPALPAVLPSPQQSETPSLRDTRNNLEQVVVLNPEPGAWTVRIRGTDVMDGPQTFGVAASPDLVDCDSNGHILFSRTVASCEAVIGIAAKDCDLNTDSKKIETINVTVTSDSDPMGVVVTLYETGEDSGDFRGTVTLTSTRGSGALEVDDGDTIEVVYVDVDDGKGGINIVKIAQAFVDCVAPGLQGKSVVSASVTPNSALIEFTTNEPASAVVRYGEADGMSCGALTHETFPLNPRTNHAILLTGLSEETAYSFEIELQDLAGNIDVLDDASCFDFTTSEGSLLVQQFSLSSDPSLHSLQGKRIMFFPINGGASYRACIEDTMELHSDPKGGTALTLGFQDFEPVVLADGATVKFYGERTHLFFVGSSGYVTFGEGDTDSSETLAEHFSLPRIAALFDNLDPSPSKGGGEVSWKQFEDRVAVTWFEVPEWNQSNENTLQIEMFYDGRIAITLLHVESNDGIVGLSPGLKSLPNPLYQTNFLALPTCSSRPPIVEDFTVATCPNTKVTIELAASDDGLPPDPGALSFRIESLPAYGTLRDASTMDLINSVPYVLDDFGAAVIYTPDAMFIGVGSEADSFEYVATDDEDGIAPFSGDSEVATVSVNVGGQLVIYFEPLDDDPKWTTTGDWDFGQPQGMGSANGDPYAGATGLYVYGNNLSGNYPNSVPGPPYDYTLTAGPFDCTDLSGVHVSFARWLGVENSSFDTATFLVSNDGMNYTVVWQHSGSTISEDEWTMHSYDISAIADNESMVYLRWSLGPTDSGIVLPGWNIDDVRLHANPPSHACPGDVNGDGEVDFDDFSIVLANYSKSGPAVPGDVNCDGVVNFTDYSIVLSLQNTSCNK